MEIPPGVLQLRLEEGFVSAQGMTHMTFVIIQSLPLDSLSALAWTFLNDRRQLMRRRELESWLPVFFALF